MVLNRWQPSLWTPDVFVFDSWCLLVACFQIHNLNSFDLLLKENSNNWTWDVFQERLIDWFVWNKVVCFIVCSVLCIQSLTKCSTVWSKSDCTWLLLFHPISCYCHINEFRLMHWYEIRWMSFLCWMSHLFITVLFPVLQKRMLSSEDDSMLVSGNVFFLFVIVALFAIPCCP